MKRCSSQADGRRAETPRWTAAYACQRVPAYHQSLCRAPRRETARHERRYRDRRGGFETSITLNRKEFGLTWNAALETGGFLVGDEVRITLSIQAIVQ